MSHVVVIGGSAGSIEVLKRILGALPADFPAALMVVIHVGARESLLPNLLERHSSLPVRHARQGDAILPGQVLVAPPDVHLSVALDGERMYARLSHSAKENHSRPAIDPLFRSAAAACGPKAIAVVLSGFLDDGSVGLQAIKARGGLAVVQDPDDADARDMPAGALRYADVDVVCRADEIAQALVGLIDREAPVRLAAAGMRGDDSADNGAAAAEAPDWVAVENHLFDEGSNMEELDQIGARAPLTCPECGGALWELREVPGSGPLRYRCHTGHAFTARVLEALQASQAEEALWAAVRSLHEQEQLYRQMHRNSQARAGAGAGREDAANEYLLRAEQAQKHAQELCSLITARARVAAG